MGKKLFLGILGAITIIIIGLLIFKPGGKLKTANAEDLYEYITVGRMDLSEKIDASGSVILSTNSDIFPAFNATVKQIYCKAGDSVRKGQLLMTLVSPQMEEQLTDTVNTLNQAQINLNTANQEFKNIKALFEIQGATITQVDDARNKVMLYEQQLDSARLKLNNLQNKPDNANFIDSSQRILLIKAPFTGVIAWINCVTGSSVVPQTSVLSIAADNSLEIEAEVNESEVKLVKTGQNVLITSSDPDQPNLRGTVSEVGTIGKANSGIVNFPVRVKVARGGSNLKAGMSADISIMVSSRPDVLAISANAVVERRGKTMVAVRDKEGVSYVRVETGFKSGANIEIISGLNEGDVIAVERPKGTNSNTNNRNNRNGGGGFRMGGFGGFRR
jgi:RND family efflux transporter MFP subunit